MSNSGHAIDPAYARLPALTIPRSRLLLRLFSGIAGLQCLMHDPDLGVVRRAHSVTGAGGARIPVIEFSPRDLAGAAPALLYCHGGGFFMGFSKMHLDSLQQYVLQTGCRLFLVDYRLSTRAPFPAAFDDCYDALCWAHAQAAPLGIDAGRIAVIGDSAGGALAAGLAQKARDTGAVAVRAQILIYPVTDCECKSESAQAFTDTPLWNAQSNRIMWDLYLPGARTAGTAPPAYASPAHCADLRGLAAAYVETAEFDPLRDEALDYARRLGEAGVRVVLNQTRGTVHGIDAAPEAPLTRAAIAERVRAIRDLVMDAPTPADFLAPEDPRQ